MYRIGIGLIAALLLGGCNIFEDPSVEEAAEIAAIGGERQLREPLRPIRGDTRVLILALDGVGWDDLRAALDAGRMPHLAGLLGRDEGDGSFERGLLVPMLTILPSATTPAWTSIFTGEPPAVTGVPGNEWFDRATMWYYAPVPVTVDTRADAAKLFSDGLLSSRIRVPTVYERADLRSHVAFHPVHRGADILSIPAATDMGSLAGALAEGLATEATAQTPEVFEKTDLSTVKEAIAAILSRGVPDLQTVYFPGIDLVTHRERDPIAGQQAYLAAVTDRGIGEILAAYRDQNALDGTYVIVVSDHGHIPRLKDDLHSLHVGEADEPTAVIEGAGFRLRPTGVGPDSTDYQAAVAFQGGMGYVYLADRSTCPAPGTRCQWTRPPRMAEDVLPVARAFHRASTEPGHPGGVHGALDLILVRAAGAGGDAPPFQVFDGERVVPVAEYLAANPRPDLLDLERRLSWLAEGPHGHLAGDILLIARTSPDVPVDERFYLGPPYWSEHGSPHRQDSQVPLVIARAGRSVADLTAGLAGMLPAEPTQLDVAGLVLGLLGSGETRPGANP